MKSRAKQLFFALVAWPLLAIAEVPLIEFVNDGATRWECVEVIDGEDILISSHVAQEKALACMATHQVQFPERDFRAVSKQRIRAVINSEAQAQLKLQIPLPSAPAENAFPAGWVDTLIDGGVRTIVSSTAAYETATGRFTITHTGGQIFSTADHFRAPTFAIASLGDVTFTAHVLQSHTGTAAIFPKSGPMLRETTGATSTDLYANVNGVDGDQGYDLARRAATSGTTSVNNQVTPAVSLCWGLRLEVDGALESWKAYYSTSCSSPSWVEYDAGTESWLGTADVVQAVLACTVNDGADAGLSGACIFDSVVVDTATSVDHSAASVVNFAPTTYQVDEDVVGGNVIVKITRSGGLSGVCTLDYVVNDGTCVAGTSYIDESGTFVWADGVGGELTEAIAVTDRAGEQQSCTFDAVASINSCSDTIGDDTATVTIVDTDGTPPPQLNAFSTQGASGCPGGRVAFIPGMRGHGSCTVGGFVADTTVIRVSNTNPTGAGSLQEAMSAGCPKVILFDVAGLINREGQFGAANCDNWSIVGASAPGAGVTLTGATNSVLVKTFGSDWTIDHLTIAAGDLSIQPTGGLGNRDSIAIGGNKGPHSNGILLNNNLIWGADETTTCYTPKGNEQSDMLYWQNFMGIILGGSGLHIIQNTCTTNASIRNFYMNSQNRGPLVRGDGYFHANNVIANFAGRESNILPCQGAATPVDDPVRMQFIHNFHVKGPNGGSSVNIESPGVETCTTFQLHETGNRKMLDDNTIVNCANNACVSGLVAGNFVAEISAVYPTGYVPEIIVNDAAGLLAFTNQVRTYSGARPTSRLAYITARLDEAINMVDGTGSEGSYTTGRTTTVIEGGISVITPASSSHDPTLGTSWSACSDNMPTGAAANAIKTSGLTGLHEWYIGCILDSIMPSGYRETGLEDYPTAP